jgi:hypothetical protein
LKKNESEGFILFARAYKVSQSVPLREMIVRVRVIPRKMKNRFALSFDERASALLLKHKPSVILLKLPFVVKSSFNVQLDYKGDSIVSEFSFPEGWIDSAELESSFFVKDEVSWLVPIESIYSPFGKDYFIIRITNGKTEFIEVSIAEYKNMQALVSGSLSEGDLILTSRLGEVVEGMRVKVSL